MGKKRLTFRRREVDDVAIFLEHIHLLDGLNRLDVELFEGSLQLLIIGPGGFVDLLRFTARSPFTSVGNQSPEKEGNRGVLERGRGEVGTLWQSGVSGMGWHREFG